MRQTAEAKVDSSLSLCCEAVLNHAAFSDGRSFVICSACGKVLAVEPRRDRRTA